MDERCVVVCACVCVFMCVYVCVCVCVRVCNVRDHLLNATSHFVSFSKRKRYFSQGRMCVSISGGFSGIYYITRASPSLCARGVAVAREGEKTDA